MVNYNKAMNYFKIIIIPLKDKYFCTQSYDLCILLSLLRSS